MATHHSTNRTDVIETITSRIESALEAGTAPWVKPWRELGGTGGIPKNGTTGKAYRGINVPMLWLTAQSMGYQSEYWLTYKQATDLGGHVSKGEKSTPIVFWKIGERTERELPTVLAQCAEE